MIISASRRTDIPALYAEWLINRLQAGFVYIRNPRNSRQLTCVELSPDSVDCIVFWTKNAQPMFDKLDMIDSMGYSYYFQYTITPYDQQIETGLPAKPQLIDSFKQLSDKIGGNRVIWRYDPVIVNAELSVQYHLDRFGAMCDALGGYTGKCIFSFIDQYAKMRKKAKGIVDSEVSTINMHRIARGFAQIAQSHGLELATCSEAIDLYSYGITHAACIDPALMEELVQYPLCARKDPNQRPDCGCMESIDIGAYDCCSHGCVYCYATASEKTVSKNRKLHNRQSPLLIGHPHGDETVTTRTAKSLKSRQMLLL